MIIRDYKARMSRSEEIKEKVCEFLLSETFSTPMILAELLGYDGVERKKTSIYPPMKRLIKEGLLMQAEIMTNYGSETVYGLTIHGYMLMCGLEQLEGPCRNFQPRKVNPNMLQHRFDLQRLHIAALKHGLKWQPCLYVESKKGERNPDAFLEIGADRWAVEAERTVKSKLRYREILKVYRGLRSKNGWAGIFFVFPDVMMKDRVRNIFRGIKSIKGSLNREEAVPPDYLEKYYRFFSYAEFVEYMSEVSLKGR